MYLNIQKFTKMKDSKIINFINAKYSALIMKQVHSIKFQFNWIPLEVEDLYNLFLFEVPELMKKYDGRINVGIYIANHVHYTIRNKIKHFLSNKQKKLSFYVPYENVAYKISDSTNLTFLDTSCLTTFEFDIYYEFIINGQGFSKLVKLKKCTAYSLRKAIKSIKTKLGKQLL